MSKEDLSSNGKYCAEKMDRPSMEALLVQGPETVCFDAESTVVKKEFFIEAQQIRGAGTLAGDLTNSAMGGGMSFNESVTARAEIVQPTLPMVASINALNARAFSPGATTLLSGLHHLGIRTHIVSGGFGEVFTMAQSQIPHTPVHANTLCFDSRGTYTGWRDGEQLAQSGGKELWLRHQRAKGAIGKRIIMVGDGMTDMIDSADLRVGYGGVTYRESVAQKADAYVYSMAALFPLVTGEKQWKRILEGDSVWRRMFVDGATELLRDKKVNYNHHTYGKEHLRRLQWHLRQA